MFVQPSKLSWPRSVSPMPPEGVDRSGASHDFTAVANASRDEVFLSSIYGNPLSIDDQGIAALYNDHVFVVFVDMFR